MCACPRLFDIMDAAASPEDFPKGPSYSIVYTFGAVLILGPFGFVVVVSLSRKTLNPK